VAKTPKLCRTFSSRFIVSILGCPHTLSNAAAPQGDPRVAQFYEKELVDKELWPLGDDLRARFEMTKTLLLKVQNHADLLGGPESQLLKQKLALRGPYVTPLNVLQVAPKNAKNPGEELGPRGVG